MLIFRFVNAIPSAISRAKIKRHPMFHYVWALICLALLFPYLRGANYYGPPVWVERLDQRKVVRARIHSVGGWQVLRNACSSLLTQIEATSGSNYFRATGASSQLPPEISALKPMLVELREDGDGIPVVVIKLFGLWSTGARKTPSYSLHVRCGPTPPGFVPKVFEHGNTVVGKSKLLAESIFEAY